MLLLDAARRRKKTAPRLWRLMKKVGLATFVFFLFRRARLQDQSPKVRIFRGFPLLFSCVPALARPYKSRTNHVLRDKLKNTVGATIRGTATSTGTITVLRQETRGQFVEEPELRTKK